MNTVPEVILSGQVQFSFNSLAAGEHKFKVKVWDNANNSSVAEFEAMVMTADQFIITDLLNYPNPMHETTIFSFNLTSEADKVSLDIFTVSGRKIKSYMKESVSGDFHEFCTWDGHDSDGDRVAAGVYIYKVTASSVNSGTRGRIIWKSSCC